MKMVELNKKWAMITGANGGIGRQTASSLAKQGCNLILHGRNLGKLQELKKEVEALGAAVELIVTDFAEEDAAEELLKELKNRNLMVDILINNAAVNLSIDREQKGEVLDYFTWTQKEYEMSMRINVAVPSILAAHLAKEMQERGFGRIVNMTSSIHGAADHLAYSITKGAINKLTGDLAEVMEGTGVSVSAVDPGWCQTYLGGEGATCTAESTSPGMLVPICMESGANGRVFQAQDFAGLTLEEAITKAVEK